MITVPDWLKSSEAVIHVPDKTIFRPQPRIALVKQVPYLLDCCGQRYPLGHCDQLRLEYLNGVALWITEQRALTVFRLDAAGDRIAITDGQRSAIVEIPDLRPKTPERRAAESLAEFFAGEVVAY